MKRFECPALAPRRGVYLIVNERTGDSYVGDSGKMLSRWKGHLNTMRLGVHENPAMNELYREHGEESFVFYVLESCGDGVYSGDLHGREACWIQRLMPTLNRPRPRNRRSSTVA